MASGELPVGSFDQIAQVDDTHSAGVKVEVPEWGLSVLVRGLSYGEVREWSAAEDGLPSDALMLKLGMVQPSLTIEQATQLVQSKNQAALRRVIGQVIELSGLGDGFRSEPTG